MAFELVQENLYKNSSDTIINQMILRHVVQRMSIESLNLCCWRRENSMKGMSFATLMKGFIEYPNTSIMTLLNSEYIAKKARKGYPNFEAVLTNYPSGNNLKVLFLISLIAYACAGTAETTTAITETHKLEKRGGLICYFMSARKGCRMGIRDCCTICCTKVRAGTAGYHWAEDCACPIPQVIVTSGPTYVTPANVIPPQTQTYVTPGSTVLTPVTYNTPVTYTTVYH
ncbi:hypothetical protein DFH28DRAFT_1085603 [Melampsora americana]|nr:hypothetical protein DFH28DRAFT_1085603 [Melampsora americana]